MSENSIEPDNFSYSLENLIKISDIKFDYLKMLSVKLGNRCRIHYDDLSQIITIYFVSSIDDAVIHYVSDDVALIYNPENMELIGIQIENIKKSED